MQRCVLNRRRQTQPDQTHHCPRKTPRPRPPPVPGVSRHLRRPVGAHRRPREDRQGGVEGGPFRPVAARKVRGGQREGAGQLVGWGRGVVSDGMVGVGRSCQVNNAAESNHPAPTTPDAPGTCRTPEIAPYSVRSSNRRTSKTVTLGSRQPHLTPPPPADPLPPPARLASALLLLLPLVAGLKPSSSSLLTNPSSPGGGWF